MYLSRLLFFVERMTLISVSLIVSPLLCTVQSINPV